ncbi:hypothetical protein JHW43_009247 [Diplocarpon mali]|nr:hypothetical protein JHW43_009247 [Diplocarpon mali]
MQAATHLQVQETSHHHLPAERALSSPPRRHPTAPTRAASLPGAEPDHGLGRGRVAAALCRNLPGLSRLVSSPLASPRLARVLPAPSPAGPHDVKVKSSRANGAHAGSLWPAVKVVGGWW